MSNYSHTVLVGNLCRDCELKYLPSNTPICENAIAVKDKWTDKQGQKHEETMFLDLVLFGKQAETFAKYTQKGSAVLVEGKLKLETWKDKQTGANRSKHKLSVTGFTFLGSRDDGERRDMEQRTQVQRGRAERIQGNRGSELYGPPDDY